jgi:hypothetical protein
MGRVSDSRYTVQASWDDVPHLDEKTKAELLASTPPHLRDARSKGIPSLGSGAIYPIALEEVLCQPFAIPPYWRRCYGFDVGWNRTAAIWLAEDPTDQTLYAYAEHYRGQAVPIIHATAIKARGDWIPGAIDPASKGRSQDEGKQLLATYRTLGLHVSDAINAVEPGIYEVWSRLETGRLRIFTTLQNLQAEYRLYRRDERGRIVKENDHLMDALRYGVATFGRIAKVKPVEGGSVTPYRAADERAGY